MSYSAELKGELCKIKVTGCCRYAECFGILFFANLFTVSEICYITENESAVALLASLVKSCFDTVPSVERYGNKRKMFRLTVTSKTAREKIVNYYKNPSADGSVNDILKKDCCSAAFLRGAFISAAVISDPQIRYNLEFVTPSGEKNRQFAEYLKNHKLEPRLSHRAGGYVAYFRNSADIEAYLTKIGLANHALGFMECEVYKDMRNRVNRRNNCETANLTKTVRASVEQKNAIEYLSKHALLQCMPSELVKLAEFRLQNPEMSLSELCENYPESITRSGMNHRLKKIVETAKKHSRENGGEF